jgi:ATP-dependent DNA ligase
MTLPLPLDYAPMEAKLVDALPEGAQWQYEPKWDGFRCLAFRDGDAVALRSKAGQPLERYFPEVVDAIRALPVLRFVLDGELVVPEGDTISFDELLMRIHPAASRVQRLAREHPALYIVFDLLVDAHGTSLVEAPLSKRREALERFARRAFVAAPAFRLSPATRARIEVDRWFATLGSGIDGAVAKRVDLPYQSGERTGMQKYKRMRTADCVVGGFRYGAKTSVVGSLLLGLYDEHGALDHVGFTSNIPRDDRKAITQALESLVGGAGFTGRAPGGPSRWSSARRRAAPRRALHPLGGSEAAQAASVGGPSSERSGEWQPLQPKLVAEVRYDHFSGGRFRHGTSFLRWRPDKAPRQCTFEQVAQSAGAPLALLDGVE